MEHYYQNVVGGFWFKPSYERILSALPKITPSEWVEVGVFHGQSLAWLGVEVVNRNLPVTIHAVDPFYGWPGVAQGEVLRASFDQNMAPLRQVLDGRLRVWPYESVEAAKSFADDSLDVVWIDADHSYDACKTDIAAWWPKLKAGGVMGGDDWLMHGVAQAVHERFGDGYMMIPGYRNDPGVYDGPWPSWVVRK